MSIYLFCEGQTEWNVVKKFAALANANVDKDDGKAQGKAQVNRKMTGTLGPLLNQSRTVAALVMRDVDERENPSSIVQSVTNAVQRMLKDRDFSTPVQFQPHATHPNVYLLALTNPDLRLALHLATYKWKEDFVNATIDDYVLALALRETTAAALLSKKRWEVAPEQIIRKVTDRIPALLYENGIPVREAKDYVRFYAAVLQEHTSPATFADTTIANASNEDKRDVFAPLLAALDFLGETEQ